LPVMAWICLPDCYAAKPTECAWHVEPMMAEEDIPVSAAMMEAGCTEWPYSDVEHFGSYDDVCAIYRAMERVRRTEADAEVIRRSVNP
jgi:hypothetical protein